MSSGRILVVDDEILIRDMVRDILADAGYEVVLASNGLEALELLRRERFGLVVTDILMPEKEGVETIVEIKKSQPQMPVIAMSGGGRTGNLHPLKIARSAGADVILTKPFEPDALVKAVQSVADPKRSASVTTGNAS